MSKISILIMKVVRRLVNKITGWYRYTSFISGLKKYEDGITVKGPVYLWNDNVSIGTGTNVYQGVTFWGKGTIDIGRHVDIGINTVIYSNQEVRIGDNTLIAADCYIIDINHGIEASEIIRMQKNVCKGPIIIEEDVWLGTGVKVMSGVHIGKGAVIGAQAVVNKDIPSNAIAVGVPAKVIGYRK